MTEDKEDIRHNREADTAEPELIVSKLLESGWVRKKLYSGDYRFWTYNYLKVGITRKTISDLLSSISKTDFKIKGKRFGDHLEEMEDFYDIKIILIEGNWKMVTPQQSIVSSRGVEYFTWDMVWNFLRTWFDRGFSLELTVNEGHTIKRLNSLYSYYQKVFHTGATTNIVGDDRVLAMPKGCRGKTGIALLNKFGSLRAVANASIEEYSEIDKIGSKKSQALWQHFNKDGKEKSNE